MTEYENVISRLEEMRDRYKIGFSPSDREFLEKLNYRLFHKIITQTGCSDCYRDAYLIIRNKLKTLNAMPVEANYILKNGILLHEFGTSEYYTHDVSDEVAEYFLKKNPADISLFQKYPEDWRTRISKKPVEKKADTPKDEPVKEVVVEDVKEPSISVEPVADLFANEVAGDTSETKRKNRKRK